MSIIDKIRTEKHYELQLYHEISQELKKIPGGTLKVNETRGRKYYMAQTARGAIKLGNINRNIKERGRERKLVSELTARHCIEKMRENIESNLRLFNRMLSKVKTYDPNELIPEFSKAYREITDGVFEHTNFPDLSKYHEMYGTDDFRPEGRLYKTTSGALVRTRVEMAIGDNYTMRRLTYIYEKKLILPDGTILHPDFTVFVPGTNKEKYHEHLGLLTKEQYINSTMWKIEKYIRAGILPNRDLILTVEETDGGLDMEKLNQMIDLFFF